MAAETAIGVDPAALQQTFSKPTQGEGVGFFVDMLWLVAAITGAQVLIPVCSATWRWARALTRRAG